MSFSDPALAASYDPLQVGLSILIAMAASYAALDLAGRVNAKRRTMRAVWQAGGAVSMGSGIWAMHFVGMLAFHLQIPILYYWPLVVAGLVVAVVASGVALQIVTLESMGLRYALVSGSMLGIGVAALHYLGMMAMRMAASFTLDPLIVAASVVLGVTFATGGMWLGYYFRDEPRKTAWRRLGAGVLMGVAISGMHYTGMAAATFRPAPGRAWSHAVYVSTLATLGIAAVILLLLATTIVSCVVDRGLEAHGFQLAIAQGKVELGDFARLTLMGELTASIAHEIKQPLAAIITNASYSLRQLATEKPNLGEIRQALQEIAEDGNRTNAIISRIRTLFTKGAPDRTPININQVLRAAIAFVRDQAERNNIEMKVDLATHLPMLPADRVQLEQAFMNVILNSIDALQAVPEIERQIHIRSRQASGTVVVQIEDSGPGFSAAESERIFEPFFTTKSGGMGLGLSITRSIVEAHGGNLSFIPVTRGVLFEFVFPLVPEPGDA